MLKAGTVYQFWTDTQGQNCNLGNMKTETWGPDRSWVVHKPEYFNNQDYIEATVKMRSLMISGPISLYDILTIKAA